MKKIYITDLNKPNPYWSKFYDPDDYDDDVEWFDYDEVEV